MLQDTIYGFIVLRDVDFSSARQAQDPFVPAYSTRSYAKASPLAGLIASKIGAGDKTSAIAAAETYLKTLAVDPSGDAPSLAGTKYPALIDALQRHAADSDAVAVEKELIAGLDAGGLPDLSTKLSDIALRRLDVADLLFSLVLTDSRKFDRNRAASQVCTFEAMERFIHSKLSLAEKTPFDDAWSTPILKGRVLLPLPEMIAPSLPPATMTMVPSPSATPPGMIAPPAKSYVGDLILLKQNVRSYRLGEVAHIENVLQSEQYERTHRNTSRSEIRTLDQRETDAESERDLQTSDRDELRKEIEHSQSDELNLRASINVQVMADLKPYTIVAGVGVEASYRRSSEQREATSQLHANEVVNRAKERYVERVKSVRETIRTSESEDTTKHGFDNRAGNGHIVGVYRWVEKKYELYLINYGRRLFYEFTVPEPATYWRRLAAAPGELRIGSPPPMPKLPAAITTDPDLELSVEHFALRDTTGKLDAPKRWSELIELAGEWGVPLDDPPRPMTQVHLALSITPDDTTKPTDKLIVFNENEPDMYYESTQPQTVISTDMVKIPPGYAGTSGQASFKGWPYIHQGRKTYADERGFVVLELAGRRAGFGVGWPDATGTFQPLINAREGFENDLSWLFQDDQVLIGEVPVGLTSVLNGVLCSLRIDCERTAAAEISWAKKMFERFSMAHAQRLEAYQQKLEQARVEHRAVTFSRPAAANRQIERHELRRGVLTQLTRSNLDQLGDLVVSEPPRTNGIKPPAVNLANLEKFGKVVAFFERAFDWQNIAYTFTPYFFGRSSEWSSTAPIEHDDAQFQQFLSAGAARVQVPIRRGFESHVEYFFAGVGLFDLSLAVPWISTSRSIAEDLAAEARDGFELAVGKISVAAGTKRITGVATSFRDPQDVDRELRIGEHIYVIRTVVSPTEVLLDRDVATAMTNVRYELGGILVGPPIPVELPSTLVAIDAPTLQLPSFPGRYA